MKENPENIKLLASPLNSDVDHLSILHEMYFKYSERSFPLSNLMKYFLNGLDDVPTNSERSLWRSDVFLDKRKIFYDSYFELLEILQSDYGSFKYNFEIIEYADLNQAKFEKYPIWSEFYDNEDIKEITSWGFNMNEVKKTLIAKTVNQQHPLYSVPIVKFSTNRMKSFIKSKFTTQNGSILEGYIMNKGESLIGIFTGNDEHIFTENDPFSEKTKRSLIKIADFYKIEVNELFELHFETKIPINVKKRITGCFNIKR